MKFATKTIHAAQPSEPETGSLIAPIFQTSTYEQESPGQDKGFNYSRTNNPSRQRLESVLGEVSAPRRRRVAPPPHALRGHRRAHRESEREDEARRVGRVRAEERRRGGYLRSSSHWNK